MSTVHRNSAVVDQICDLNEDIIRRTITYVQFLLVKSNRNSSIPLPRILLSMKVLSQERDENFFAHHSNQYIVNYQVMASLLVRNKQWDKFDAMNNLCKYVDLFGVLRNEELEKQELIDRKTLKLMAENTRMSIISPLVNAIITTIDTRSISWGIESHAVLSVLRDLQITYQFAKEYGISSLKSRDNDYHGILAQLVKEGLSCPVKVLTVAKVLPKKCVDHAFKAAKSNPALSRVINVLHHSVLEGKVPYFDTDNLHSIVNDPVHIDMPPSLAYEIAVENEEVVDFSEHIDPSILNALTHNQDALNSLFSRRN